MWFDADLAFLFKQDRGFTSSSNVIKTGKAQNSFQTPGAGNCF